MTDQADTAAPDAPLSIAAAAEKWEQAKTLLRLGIEDAERSQAKVKGYAAEEQAARRAFNAAVDAMRPKRGPRKAKQEGGAA